MGCDCALRRSTLRLVECLVVRAILGTLAGMLLAAVPPIRKPGKRLRCSNHLQELGLALPHDHDTDGLLPSNGGWDHKQWVLSADGQRTSVSRKDAAVSIACDRRKVESPHPAGAQVLLADGPNRLIAYRTPARTLHALQTPKGGDEAPEF